MESVPFTARHPMRHICVVELSDCDCGAVKIFLRVLRDCDALVDRQTEEFKIGVHRQCLWRVGTVEPFINIEIVGLTPSINSSFDVRPDLDSLVFRDWIVQELLDHLFLFIKDEDLGLQLADVRFLRIKEPLHDVPILTPLQFIVDLLL